jgi:hypothetical protein
VQDRGRPRGEVEEEQREVLRTSCLGRKQVDSKVISVVFHSVDEPRRQYMREVRVGLRWRRT